MKLIKINMKKEYKNFSELRDFTKNDLEGLLEIIENLETQDTRYTRLPLYIIEEDNWVEDSNGEYLEYYNSDRERCFYGYTPEEIVDQILEEDDEGVPEEEKDDLLNIVEAGALSVRKVKTPVDNEIFLTEQEALARLEARGHYAYKNGRVYAISSCYSYGMKLAIKTLLYIKSQPAVLKAFEESLDK